MNQKDTFTLGGKEFHEGDAISLDGSTGNIYDGIIPTVDATIAGEFGRIMGWAEAFFFYIIDDRIAFFCFPDNGSHRSVRTSIQNI